MTAMPFEYPRLPHVRKHGPYGYVNPETYKDWLRDEFSFRCVYCLERERWYPNGHAAFGIDHIKPKSAAEYVPLIGDYENLVYACNQCNSSKRQELLLNPCVDVFADHLRVSENGEITGITIEGKDFVDILRLDRSDRTEERRKYLRLRALFQRYPDDAEVRELYLRAFGFPDELPDLASLRPPGNTKPEGLEQSYLQQRETGCLPATY